MTIKNVIFVGLILFMIDFVYSWPNIKISGSLYPPNTINYESDAVYVSSNICGGAGAIILSTRPAEISHINITSVATAGSWMEIWDANTSTNANAIRIAGPINVDILNDWYFKTGTSSGIILNIQKSVASSLVPCIQVIHFER